MTSPPLPWLESVAARLGVGVIVALSIGVGWSYWAERDEKLAWLTVGAELIAFAGLAVAASHRWRYWGRKLGALLVTALAAGWCGYTMYQSIDADTRAEALAAARERPAYVFAANAAQTASRLLSERLTHPSARPECACPDTLAQWENSEAAAIERLRDERDAAIAQMEAATPEPPTDWGAIGRGISVEMAKLLGFMVFGLAVSPTLAALPGALAPAPTRLAALPGALAPAPTRLAALPGALAPAPTRTRVGWGARLLAGLALAPPAALANTPEAAYITPESQALVVLSPEMGTRAVAFSMRGRFSPMEIAAKTGVHWSTVYRWFRERDKAMAKAA